MKHALKLDTMHKSISRHLHGKSRSRLAGTIPCKRPANPCFVQPHVAEAMSVVVDVGLLSGKTVSVEAKLDELTATWKRRAQTALAVGKGRLLDAFGGLLDDEQTVEEAWLETGTSLSLQLQMVEIQAFQRAFAAILGDGSALSWGDKNFGGDSRAVQDQLKGVQQIQASGFGHTLDIKM